MSDPRGKTERLSPSSPDGDPSTLSEMLAHPERTARKTEANSDDLSFLSPASSIGDLGQLGSYRILKLLGKGGMGLVFLAEDPSLRRQVALKVIQPEVARKAAARERFLREARAVAQVEHDHIVHVHQVGEANGLPYFVMPLLKGMTLQDWLNKGRPLTLPQIYRLGRETCKGLAAAHARGLVHRDIKPANLWLDATTRGRIKILDFGLARVEGEDTILTQDGMVVGTPSYMAPEQATGGVLDARTDIYSVGAVLYRLLTGQPPFKKDTVLATLAALGSEKAKPPKTFNPQIPQALNDLVLKMLAKNPADRPASAKAVVEALLACERQPDDTAPTLPPQALLGCPAINDPANNDPSKTEADDEESVASLLEFPSAERPPRSWAKRARVIGLGVLLAILLAGLAWAVVQRRESTGPMPGTLVLATPQPKVKLFLDQNGQLAKIFDPEIHKEIDLPSGEYVIKLEGGGDGLMLEQQKLHVTPGSKHSLSLSQLVVPVAPPTKPVPVPKVIELTSPQKAEALTDHLVLSGHLTAKDPLHPSRKAPFHSYLIHFAPPAHLLRAHGEAG